MFLVISEFPMSGGAIGGVLGVVVFFLIILFLKSLLKVTHPDKLLVVTGRKRSQGTKKFGFSVERGSTMIVPYFQSVNNLDLRILPINVRVEGVNSANGITLGADATACVCIDEDNEAMLYSAVERLMGKDTEELTEQVSQTLIGNFRGALNKATPLEAIGMDESADMDEELSDKEKAQGERALFRNALLEDINSDISSFGMRVVSVSLQKIWDTSNYIANLAQKTIAHKRQQVEIEEAKLIARAEEAESDANKRISVARSRADEQIVAAREKLQMFEKESKASINKTTYQAEQKIATAKNRVQTDIEALNNELIKLQNESDILLKEKAKKEAAIILSEGDEASAKLIEGAKNKILTQKVELLSEAGDIGNIVLFVKQQLPNLYKAYKSYATNFKIDSYVAMDSQKGFSGVVNRGPQAFVDFLRHFEDATNVRVKDFINLQDKN
jgi:uncharacterized membrane protein YqiK